MTHSARGPVVAAHGTWSSPLTPARAAAAGGRFSALALDVVDGEPLVWWAESRPHERGRTVVMCVGPELGVVEIGEPGSSVRGRVNEYGGGALLVHPLAGHTVRLADHTVGLAGHTVGLAGHRVRRLWVQETPQEILAEDLEISDGRLLATDRPRVITSPAPSDVTRALALGAITGDGRWVVAEAERRVEGAAAESVNELIVVDVLAQRDHPLVGPSDPGGGDFVGDPQLSPDGRTLAWLRWDHPDMPWDAAELWAARLERPEPDAVPVVRDARRVAGGHLGGRTRGLSRPVSVCLPRWSPDGRLWWCDDSDDWWTLRSVTEPGLPGAGAGDVVDDAAGVPPPSGAGAPGRENRGEEIGEPRWVAGGARYGFTSDGRVVFAASSGGLDGLWIWDPRDGRRSRLGPDLVSVEMLAVADDYVAVIGGTGERPNTVWRIDLADGRAHDLRPVDSPLPPEWVSMPRPVSFPSGPALGNDPDGPIAHALYYPPRSGDHVATEGSRPPLVVRIHGGPTASARTEFSPSVQFWTTRGFAVAEVNYRGSTGYGREYRDALDGQWGVADVQDCIAVTRHLAREGLVDPSRCVIRGGSSGGFTALAAVCFQGQWGAPGAFAAACSLYGVTDLAALAAGTHKFEARYLDGLVAPLPEGADIYRERSPLHHAENLDTPVLLLQGGRDRIVPPEQAEVLVAALEANGVKHSYVLFENEGHGFLSADTVVTALEVELAFYLEVLGLGGASERT